MARRRKEKSFFSLALEGRWTVSAIYVAALSFLTFVVVPLVSNPILKIFAQTLKPVGLILIGVFTLIAVVKFLRAKSNSYQYRPLQNTEGSKPADWPDIPRAPREVSDAERKFFLSGSRGNKIERPTEWSLKLVKDIEWKRFEELSTAYYLEKGIRAEATSLGADGGIDIKLYQDDTGNPSSIVQCKAWNSRQVGVKQIREFLGVMTHERIAKGFYMTSGEYSEDAKNVAKDNRITLINGEMLLMMIKRLPEESQTKLLALATEGDYTTPSCPSCGVKMVQRSGKRGDFWGCKNYPRCRQMLHLKSAEK